MNPYLTSILLLLIAIILCALALIYCINSYQFLRNSNCNDGTNCGFIEGVLIFLSIVFAIMILFFCYGLVRVRTSNMGGWFTGIIALLLVIAGVVLLIISLYKISSDRYKSVIDTLSFALIILPLTYLFAVMSVWAKPKLTTVSMAKKLMKGVKEAVKMEYQEPAVGTGLVEVDGPLYAESENVKSVSKVEEVIVEKPAKSSPLRKSPRSTRTVVIEE